jgi:hypothetical protein
MPRCGGLVARAKGEPETNYSSKAFLFFRKQVRKTAGLTFLEQDR